MKLSTLLWKLPKSTSKKQNIYNILLIWFIISIQSDLFWHRCLERQAFGTPRMYTLSPSKSIKGSNYGEFLKDKIRKIWEHVVRWKWARTWISALLSARALRKIIYLSSWQFHLCLFVILTAIGWFIISIQSDLFWHRCFERQAFGTPRMYTPSPSKSIKGCKYREFTIFNVAYTNWR
jgi:fatty-acid desaturase